MGGNGLLRQQNIGPCANILAFAPISPKDRASLDAPASGTDKGADQQNGHQMKTRIRDIRRQDMQKAAFDVLAEVGFHGATLGKVAERLGMSRGLVHHYFKNKEELLEIAVRYGNRLISEEVARSLRRCTTPRERLDAIVEANFGDEIYIVGRAQYWISYCAEATISERLARLLHIQNSRMRSNLLHELRSLLSAKDAERLAEILSMLMDGMWVRMAVTRHYPRKQDAIDIIRDLLQSQIKPARAKRVS
jgi:TetR/AcrR family transcriptional repressor of bet genes